MKSYQIILIIILALAVGYMWEKLKKKRKEDIIKLLFRQDMLPAPANNTQWLDGGACFMNDGSQGKVRGVYCQQIRPL